MSATSNSKLVTNSNDVSFPRGGATALTPMEVKEISNEVAKDVLFESAKSSKRTKSSQDGEVKTKRAKKSKSASKSKDTDDTEEQKAQIENFNFKNLIPGVTVLGQVSSINKMDIALTFGDNLSGYVPITSISAEVTRQLEMIDAAEEESDEEIAYNEDDEQVTTTANLREKSSPEMPQLSKLFTIGQWLRAKVVEPTDSSNKKKRIQLTIDPAALNEEIDTSDFIPGNIIQCSVKSVEDHGVIVDIGTPDYSGFISHKSLKDLTDFGLQFPGQTFLAAIQSKPARRTINLAPLDVSSKKSTISTISSIDAVQPGILVDALVSDVTKNGIVATVFGMMSATINLANLHEFDYKQLKHKYAIGNKIKARIVAVLLKEGTKKLILSNLQHVMSFRRDPNDSPALESFPIGHIFNEVEVKGSDPNYIFVSFGSSTLYGEIHQSNVDTSKDLDIDYNVGSKHKAKVIGYNKFDNLLILSMRQAVIDSQYLSIDDIPSGLLITDAVILSVFPEASGILLKVFDSFEALVPASHMSDIKLVYPEKKFKVGARVKARTLKKQGRKLLATLKRSLVNIQQEEVLNNFEGAEVGLKTPATVEKFVHNGAIVSFFGNLSAFLPKNEISETFVNKASDYLKMGQTVNVRVASIKEDDRKLVVTLKQSSDLTQSDSAMSSIDAGKSISTVIVIEKTKDSLICEYEGSRLHAIIYSGHLSDGNYEQNRALLKSTPIGQKVEVLALEKEFKNNIVIVSAKKSLIEASKRNEVPSLFKDIKPDSKTIKGYVKSVTNMGIFVSFAGKLTGLVLAKYAVNSKSEDIFQKFYKYQSISCKVIRVDEETKRFLLTLDNGEGYENFSNEKAINPIDKSKEYLSDFTTGVVTRAKINSIKGTQLNVQLSDNLQGRVDITQCFDSFSDIKNHRQPLTQFQKNSEIQVKVIGFHDAKNHRFLPVTHQRSNKYTILELSMLAKEVENKDSSNLPNLTSFEKGSTCISFVNNITKGFVWVSVTPQIRGRISFMDLTDDSSVFEDLDNKLPIGSALQVKVQNVDTEHNILHLSGRESPLKSFDDVSVGSKYPCRILKVKEQYVLVELAKDVLASSFITDALDDYSSKLNDVFKTNDFALATVVATDEDAKKVAVSLKTSEAKDKMIESFKDLNRGDVVRGFIKNITNGGIYVALGRSTHALVRVSDLSDSYLKDWKKYFKPHQVVKGKISSCNEEGRVSMTLKDSEVNGDLNTLKKFEDLEVGDIFEGSVKGVTDFGVFVKLDGTLNVSGLCHHSEIADNDIKDVAALFGEGDRVKVKVLATDQDKKQLSLGMKASYFKGDQVDINESQDDESESDVEAEAEEEESSSDSDEEMEVFGEEDLSADEMEVENSEDEADDNSNGLSTNGFDWTASILDQADSDSSSEDEDVINKESRKKKKKSARNVVDKTAELNTRAPQSVSDFERLLVGSSNSSVMWMNYMSFQLQLSEIDKAREIGERALRTINYREEQEKLNIWIALLNLENSFGTDETLDDVFKRSCQYMESLLMHQKLLGILVMSEKFDKADVLYRVAIKKFGKHVSIWVSYCSFLLDRGRTSDAHEILSRALQALPKKDHIEVVRKFAQLEFSKGDQEQGRSLFEGLISDAPKRIDLWNVYLDQEIKIGEKSKVEDLFERALTKKLSRKQAKFFFSKWLSFEESRGDEQACARVKAKATEYVQSQ